MKQPCLLLVLLAAFLMNNFAQSPADLSEIWDKEHVTNKLPSNVRHADLKLYLEKLKSIGLKVDEVGRSFANREIYQVEWGKGPKRVFLWSQMHGDEPTATSALIDMFTVLQKNRHKEWVKRIEKELTIRAVPMLNPDGAELYIRRNLQGIDINRDALNLVTPEARLLKQLREAWLPEIGFNLHNQNELTTAGNTNQQASISFLVVYGDEAKTESEAMLRNKRIVVLMTEAIRQFIPGHISRYGDEYTATAFGDSFSAWGTPVILIETGALHGKDEMYLVKINFIAFLTAMRALADGSEKAADPVRYFDLPNNSSGNLLHIIFRNANVIDRQSGEASPNDIGLNFERRRAQFSAPATIRRIGALTSNVGLVEYDASGFFVVGRMLPIKPGNPGELLFYKKDRKIDWTATDVEMQFAPDAILSFGKWLKGEGVVPTKK
ncbi:MAG: M14 family zinc carboxypeptidase [Pyrinomonadaceae bacterium]